VDLINQSAITVCIYCGADVKVERSLRRTEPEIPPCIPSDKGDNSREYDYWNSRQLINGIINETDSQKRIEMAQALDSWSHVNEETAGFVSTIAEIMLSSDKELDMALSGIMGKLICSDDKTLCRKVIDAGEYYGFKLPGSPGLIFALSLGDAATVKLLLDIAQWAVEQGDEDYAEHALIGVQTAIGRERDHLQVCMEILIYRFMYMPEFVKNWIARFLRNHFDVGYTFMHGFVLELIDDCEIEAPHFTPLITDALKKCSGTQVRDEFLQRLDVFGFIKSNKAKAAALESLKYPPESLKAGDVEKATGIIAPMLWEEELKNAASDALSKFVWVGSEVPLPIMDLYNNRKEELPNGLIYSIELRMDKR
jgi:hypothetical protein